MPGKTIGLVVALAAEARALTGRVQPAEQVVALSDRSLIRVGGAGAEAAAASCRALADAGAEALISAGCAAGLSADARPGALVLPREVRWAQGGVLTVDDKWHQALTVALSGEFQLFGLGLISVGGVIGPDEKRALHRETGAVAADMESAAAGFEAARLGVPFVTLRAVSDGPADAVPASLVRAVDRFGHVGYGSLIRALTRRPLDAKMLMRLHRGFKSACRTLSRAAAMIGPGFCCPPPS